MSCSPILNPVIAACCCFLEAVHSTTFISVKYMSYILQSLFPSFSSLSPLLFSPTLLSLLASLFLSVLVSFSSRFCFCFVLFLFRFRFFFSFSFSSSFAFRLCFVLSLSLLLVFFLLCFFLFCFRFFLCLFLFFVFLCFRFASVSFCCCLVRCCFFVSFSVVFRSAFFVLFLPSSLRSRFYYSVRFTFPIIFPFFFSSLLLSALHFFPSPLLSLFFLFVFFFYFVPFFSSSLPFSLITSRSVLSLAPSLCLVVTSSFPSLL